MSRKIDRALRGPSWIEVVLGAAISLVLGVALGAALLVFRPVIPVRQMPKEEAIERDAIYFVEGSRETAKARDAAAKRKAPPRPSKPAAAKSAAKTIVLYPEAAFGPALNCVGIAQQLKAMGHNPVFVCDRSFKGVFENYGFEENLVDMSGGMSDAEIADFWGNFIAGHLPHFRLSPIEQVRTYVVPVWEMIVDTAINSHEMLTAHLQSLKPDVVCVDNVILFPAIKQYGVPWVRIISCSENEIEDPAIPPHLSGCGENDTACHQRYRDRFNEVIKPIHDDFNAFLTSAGEAPYPLGQFFEASPYLNLLLYPEPVKFRRRHPLDPRRFQYLEGCVRKEAAYTMPTFTENNDGPLVYVSFGSHGAGDTELLKRVIAALGHSPYGALVNVGGYKDQYSDVPGNVVIES